MCTVTYLPFNQREFILTANRDEDVSRQTALPVREYQINDRTIFFPKDQKAQGAWIAYDVKGYTLCLLNGANKAHTQKALYKKSRGLMLLDFYLYNEPESFAKLYDFKGIAAFTLILAYSCSNTKRVKLYELKWDEEQVELIAHDSSLPQIWSSVTLYSKEVIEERRSWFEVWLSKNNSYTTDTVLFFHHFAGNGSRDNDLVINRGTKKTVSICCIKKNMSHTDIIYEDLINRSFHKSKVINC